MYFVVSRYGKHNVIYRPHANSFAKTTLAKGFGKRVRKFFQVIRDIKGTHTCFFVELQNTPKDLNITYGKIVFDYKPHKKEKELVRITVGGDILEYSGEVATSTADLTTFKILALAQR
jgi:hypothetical protein